MNFKVVALYLYTILYYIQNKPKIVIQSLCQKYAHTCVKSNKIKFFDIDILTRFRNKFFPKITKIFVCFANSNRLIHMNIQDYIAQLFMEFHRI